MDKKALKNTAVKTVRVTGKVLRIGLGVGLLLADITASAVGAILCAVTSQD